VNSISINQFINNLQNLIKQVINQHTPLKITNQDGADFVLISAKDEDQIALAEKFNQLCEDTQKLFIDNPITEEEIQSEIDAYLRSE
jgi:hypothetical protein